MKLQLRSQEPTVDFWLEIQDGNIYLMGQREGGIGLTLCVIRPNLPLLLCSNIPDEWEFPLVENSAIKTEYEGS